jgi:hypothetical protein
MQNLKFLFAALLLMVHVAVSAQDVGVGTNTPNKKLSVAGSIAVDHDNANTGTLDSAALVFGTGPSLVGIFSKKTPGSGSYNGLDFWTNGERRMIITEGGTVGINVQNPDLNSELYVGGKIESHSFETNNATVSANASVGSDLNVGDQLYINGSPYYTNDRLVVNDGDSYFGGNGHFTGYLVTDGFLTVNEGISADEDIYSWGQIRGTTLRATEYMGVGGLADPNYRLRVWDGNSRFGGDVQVTGNLDAGAYMAVGGAIDPVYRLRVYNGNSRFGGDVQVTGNLNAGEITTNTINGTGVVHSAGPSSLSMGFNSENINLTLAGGNQLDLTVNITDFSGGANDIRVMIGQFVPDPLPQYANWHDFSLHVHSVDPVNDTCKLRVTNTTGANLSMKGTLYLISVVKE